MADPTNTPEQSEEERRRLDEQARARQDITQNPRMQAMAAIDAANLARIEEQLTAEGMSLGVPIGEQPTPTPEPTPQPTAAPTPSPSPAPTPAPSASPAPALDPQLVAQLGTEPVPLEALDHVRVRVKIDGEERLMTLHDIRRSTQLDGAAHRRLEQANALLEQARAQTSAAAPAPGAPASPPVGVAPAAPKADSAPASSTEDITALVNALFTGDAEAAGTALQKVLRPQPALDPQSLVQQVVPAVKQQLSVEEANRQFRSDFPDIVGDPHLATAADGFYAEVLAEDPHKSYADALAEAGKRTRDWMAAKGMRPATEPARGSTRQEKLARKEQIDEVRGLNRTASVPEEKVPTPSDIIAEMRQQRGLGA